MKKIFGSFVILGLFVSNNAFAVGGAETLTYKGKHVDDNEFLYQDEENYLLSKNGYENSKNDRKDKNSGDGKGFECDKKHYTNGSIISMPVGHYFKGEKIDHAEKYVCKIGGGDDLWVPVNENTCNEFKGVTLSVGQKRASPLGQYECSGQTMTEPDIKLVKSWDLICREGPQLVCKPHECIQGYNANITTGRCELNIEKCNVNGQNINLGQNIIQKCSTKPASLNGLENGDDCYVTCTKRKSDNQLVQKWSIKNCNNNYEEKNSASAITDYQHIIVGWLSCVKQQSSDRCLQLYPNGTPERLACCRAGKATTWNESEKKCTCVDTNKEWTWTSPDRYGQCLTKEVVGPVIRDNEKICTVYTTTEIKCANGNYYRANVPVQLSGITDCEIAQRLSNTEYLAALQNAICGAPNNYTIYLTGNINEQQLSSAQSAVSSLNGFFENEKVSVWKDKDGEFNKARLASDLTAGVVLGTVGGVVSGVVIKKKQVEKGFEALHCTVGGQTVADWGDEFRVGLKQ